MKFLSPTIHGALDYIAALTLIIAPFALGLQNLALWLSVAAGSGLIFYSLLTDYSYSISKVIPFKLHIIFDSLAAIVFILAPFIFDFTGITKIYYWVMGVGVLFVVFVTQKVSA
jgi:hypothetical protein